MCGGAGQEIPLATALKNAKPATKAHSEKR
jgi:hypothetical protein